MFSENTSGLHAGFLPEWIRSSWGKINGPPLEEVFIRVKTEMESRWGHCITGRPSMETESIHPHLPCQVLAFCSTLALIAKPAHMSVALLGPPHVHLGSGKYKKWDGWKRKTLLNNIWTVFECTHFKQNKETGDTIIGIMPPLAPKVLVTPAV